MNIQDKKTAYEIFEFEHKKILNKRQELFFTKEKVLQYLALNNIEITEITSIIS